MKARNRSVILFKDWPRAIRGLYTIDVTGGIGSPRHYGGISKDPLLSPSHSHSACPATPTHSQHNATNTQHYSSQQHTPLLYQQHTNTADMQNSQFCYADRSVPLYPSGGEAQDARSLPPGNPVNHQMGGKSYDFLMSCDTSLSSQSHATSSINYNYHLYQHLNYQCHYFQKPQKWQQSQKQQRPRKTKRQKTI